MNNDYILAIGIMTYNGSKSIITVIDSVISEIKRTDLNGKVEIVVVDNDSSDNTYELVSNVKYNDLHIYKNEKNIGFDRNVDAVVQKAKSDYIWFLSDNDLICEGKVRKVYDIVHSNPDLGFLFVNFDNPIKIELDQDKTFYSGNDFYRACKFKNGMISSNIVNKKIWTDIDMSRYFDSKWIQFGYSIEAVTKAPSHIIPDCCIKEVPGLSFNWGSEGSFIHTGLNLVELFKKMDNLKYYKKDVRKKADFVIKGSYPKAIVSAKAAGLNTNLQLIKRFIKLYSKYPSFWFLDFPSLLIPGAVVRFLYLKIYKVLKNKAA